MRQWRHPRDADGASFCTHAGLGGRTASTSFTLRSSYAQPAYGSFATGRPAACRSTTGGCRMRATCVATCCLSFAVSSGVVAQSAGSADDFRRTAELLEIFDTGITTGIADLLGASTQVCHSYSLRTRFPIQS